MKKSSKKSHAEEDSTALEKDLFLEDIFKKDGNDFAKIRRKGFQSSFQESLGNVLKTKQFIRFQEKDILKLCSFYYTSKEKSRQFSGEKKLNPGALIPLIFLIMIYVAVHFLIAFVPVK